MTYPERFFQLRCVMITDLQHRIPHNLVPGHRQYEELVSLVLVRGVYEESREYLRGDSIDGHLHL